ncbi:MAG: hypothetical protein WBP81_01875 [Solirubrobacteraceae bacterium]
MAVGVDVLVGQRGDPLDFAGGDQLAVAAELIEDLLGVDGVPDDDRVARDGQTERLLGLLFRRAVADVALVGVEEMAAQRVELLAFVELAANPLA